jgi:hypothetical protein
VTIRRFGVWLAALALVVWLGRAIAYGLSDAPLAQRLAGDGGGTTPATVAAVSLVLSAGLSAVGLWLVATGVRERARLDLERWDTSRSPLRLAVLGRRMAMLSVASAVCFTSFESWLHWREGLGFHAYHCLFGPVHQDALPILVGLSVLVAALITAADAVLAFARRTVARKLLARRRHGRRPWTAMPHITPRPIRMAGGRHVRGPPLPA